MRRHILDQLRIQHGLGPRPQPVNDWAENEARRLIADEFRKSGCPSNAKQYESDKLFTTAPLRAFARYIREGKRVTNT